MTEKKTRTAEELFAAAAVAHDVGLYDAERRLYTEGMRVEQETPEGAYILELAKYTAETSEPSMKWEEWTTGPGSFQDSFIKQTRAALEKLAADGRLVPDGGVALQGWEFEAIRQVVTDTDRAISAKEFRKLSVRNAVDVLSDRFVDPDIAVQEAAAHEWPSDEEVRLEWDDHTLTTPAELPIEREAGMNGPWQRWQDVPDDVYYRSKVDSILTWVNRRGKRMYRTQLGYEMISTLADHETNKHAPFVRTT